MGTNGAFVIRMLQIFFALHEETQRLPTFVPNARVTEFEWSYFPPKNLDN